MQLAEQLVQQLAETGTRVVFAESCTGGLVSAELAKVPGVSEFLCGSAVAYRSDTKVKWLGVRQEDIDRHTAVSQEVAGQMAEGVLAKTPEAAVSASITGHFGPGAPDGFDGVVFIGVASRRQTELSVQVSRYELNHSGRVERQAEAAELVWRQVLKSLQ